MNLIPSIIRNAGGSRLQYVVNAIPSHVPKVLDIGCSYGWALGQLTANAGALYGVDMDEAALAQARVAYPHVNFVHQSAARLPFPDETFDVVILSEVIEHVGDENKQAVIDEAYRVLKPSGLFVFTAPHAGAFAWADPLDFKRRCRFLYRIYMRVSGRTPQTPIEVGHKHVSWPEVARLFAGRFEDEDVRYSGLLGPWLGWVNGFGTCLPVRLMSRRVEYKLGEFTAWESGVRCPRWLADSIRLTARKRRPDSAAPLLACRASAA